MVSRLLAFLVATSIVLIFVQTQGSPSTVGVVAPPLKFGIETPVVIPSGHGTDSFHDQLLCRYIVKVDKLRQDLEAQFTMSIAQSRIDLSTEGASLKGKRQEVLDQIGLLAHSNQGASFSLTELPDTISPPNPISDDSEWIYASSVNRGYCTATQILAVLANSELDMTKGWADWVQSITTDVKESDDNHHLAMCILYQNGRHTSAIQDELMRLVNEQHDPLALSSLLFSSAGAIVPIPIVSTTNLELYKSIIDQHNTSPEMILMCAEYAIAVRDHERGIAVIKWLYSQHFTTNLSHPLGPLNENDAALARARNKSLSLLFYAVQNQDAFELLYDKAYPSWAGHIGVTKPLESLPDANQFRLESDFAKSLLQKV